MTRRAAAGIGAAVAIAALALAACGGGPAPAAPRPAADAAAPSEAGAPRLGALSPRELASGECGLFLWSRASGELVFFSNPETGRAAIVADGRERSLLRLSMEGAASRPRAQTFATESGDVSLRLAIQETEPMEGGYRVRTASLRVSNAEGWSGVVPAAGLAACRT